jgi:pilus assembly protein CpaE
MVTDLRSRLEEEAGFEIVMEIESLPGVERISALIASTDADCLFLGVSEVDGAIEFLRSLDAAAVKCPVVAFSEQHQPSTVFDMLRAGAFDYLTQPFPGDTIQAVCLRLQRHRGVQTGSFTPAAGKVIGFASSKPGSGASTLVAQTAFALRRHTGKRVLLVDLNFRSGTSSSWAGVKQTPWSVLDALARLGRGEESSRWSSELVNTNGISILPAPSVPEADHIDSAEMLRLIETVRRDFDWVLLDLPCTADLVTLELIPELDGLVAVTTPELSSLHLAARSIHTLTALGLAPANLHLALNRVTKHDALQVQQVEQVLKRKIAWVVPNDYFTLHNTGLRALTGEQALAVAVRRIASGLSGPSAAPGASNPAGLRQLTAVAAH